MAGDEFRVHTAELHALGDEMSSHAGKVASKSVHGGNLSGALPGAQSAKAAAQVPAVFEQLMHATAARLRDMASACHDNAGEYDKVDAQVETAITGSTAGARSAVSAATGAAQGAAKGGH